MIGATVCIPFGEKIGIEMGLVIQITSDICTVGFPITITLIMAMLTTTDHTTPEMDMVWLRFGIFGKVAGSHAALDALR